LYGIVAMQAIIACLGGLAAGLSAGKGAALALIYGVALMSANGIWLYRGIERATRDVAADGQHLLYRSAAFRFLFLLLALGLADAAGLFLPWVAAGMLAAQAMVYVYGLIGFRRSRA
jgi:H+/Cl- antiporter ClcA